MMPAKPVRRSPAAFKPQAGRRARHLDGVAGRRLPTSTGVAVLGIACREICLQNLDDAVRHPTAGCTRLPIGVGMACASWPLKPVHSLRGFAAKPPVMLPEASI